MSSSPRPRYHLPRTARWVSLLLSTKFFIRRENMRNLVNDENHPSAALMLIGNSTGSRTFLGCPDVYRTKCSTRLTVSMSTFFPTVKKSLNGNSEVQLASTSDGEDHKDGVRHPRVSRPPTSSHLLGTPASGPCTQLRTASRCSRSSSSATRTTCS